LTQPLTGVTQPSGPESRRFLAPRYWPTWLGFGLSWLITRLPYRWQMGLGRWLGRLSLVIGKRRAHIARVNLRLCFPDMSEAEREELVRRHFESLGMSVLETAMCWWLPEQRLRRLARMDGMEHLEAALSRGKGALLLTGHFTTLEMGAHLMALHVPIAAMYREHKNPLFEAAQRRAREKHAVAGGIIGRGDIRGTLRSLKKGLPVWYAPDQDYGRRHGIFVPFFGVPAATVVATSRLANMSGAPVVPYFPQRLADGTGYRVRVEPPLADFPSGDIERDTRRINALIEERIGDMPEQYLWSHRRFKTRPPGEPSVYERTR
jgi:KDO2-lipid IV(A) lauroyltransferase